MGSFHSVAVEKLLADDRGISVGVMYPGEDTLDGIPLIRVGDIIGNRISSNPGYRISKRVHEEYRRTALVGGECLITLVGRPGVTLVVPPEMRGWNAARALAVVRLKDPEDARFFAYSMSAPAVQNTIENWCNTTVQATLNLKEIKALMVPWPERRDRQRIVEVLGSLDDKIELNRRMNETLEAMAQVIFRDWFVDFGPTLRKLDGATDPLTIMGGLVRDAERAQALADLFPAALGDDGLPEGWRETTLESYSSLNPESWSAKTAPDQVEYVDLANTKRGTIESTSVYSWEDAPSRARRIVRSGDTIVGTVRPGNGSYAFVGRDGLTASTGFAVLRPKQPAFTEFVNCAATVPENIERLEKLADGGAYPAVKPEVVVATPVPLVNGNVASAFSGFAAPMFKKIVSSKEENRTLAAIRDLLLPKLMSGEIRLSAASEATA
jgi:type I restriction enzyme, S subunit